MSGPEGATPLPTSAGGEAHPHEPDHHAARARADLHHLIVALREAGGSGGLALGGLFVLGLFYTLYFARAFFLPLTLGLLAYFVLRPVVRGLERLRLPTGVAAGVVIVAVVGLAVLAGQALVGPAAELAKQAPAGIRRIETKIRQLRKPVEEVGRATERMEALTRGKEPDNAVVVKQEGLGDSLASGTKAFLGQAVVVIFLLYFLLAAGDALIAKLAQLLMSDDRDEADARNMAREVEREVSRYLLTVTLINFGEGLAVGIALWLLGVPSPVFWGVAAAFANFVPYLGAVAFCVVVSLSAFSMLPPERALLVPIVYTCISSLEGYLVTPFVMGKRMTLDPVVVFLCVIFWSWLWGTAGAIVAVPMLVVLKITCDHVPKLAPVAELLEGTRRETA
jgi:predicted PurR-regulated permease PerM